MPQGSSAAQCAPDGTPGTSNRQVGAHSLTAIIKCFAPHGRPHLQQEQRRGTQFIWPKVAATRGMGHKRHAAICRTHAPTLL